MKDGIPHEIFSALAEPRRLAIVQLLSEQGQLSATAISDEFQVTSAAISQHLRVLREAELISMKKQAQKRIYFINPDAFDEISEWATQMKKIWTNRFNQLDTLLKES